MGVVSFHGLDLITVAGRVMTPRPASERLVDAAVAIAGNGPARIADVGTGSGAIAVALGSLLDPVPGALDLIVANLPYLPLAEASGHPDLAGEPSEAVFAGGDGLDAYRALVTTSRERLTTDGALVIQLHRRVLAARRDQLDTLAATLATSSTPTANVHGEAAA